MQCTSTLLFKWYSVIVHNFKNQDARTSCVGVCARGRVRFSPHLKEAETPNLPNCQIASHLHKYNFIVLLECSGDISIKYPSLVLQYCMYTFFSTIQETQPKIRISWHAHCKVILIGCSFEPILWNEQNIAAVGFSQQVAINHKKRD